MKLTLLKLITSVFWLALARVNYQIIETKSTEYIIHSKDNEYYRIKPCFSSLETCKFQEAVDPGSLRAQSSLCVKRVVQLLPSLETWNNQLRSADRP